jgi:hypothetical protein
VNFAKENDHVKLRTRLLGAVGVLSIAGALVATTAPVSAAPTSEGSCTGATTLATVTPGLTDQTQLETAAIHGLKQVSDFKEFLGGTCNGLVENPLGTTGQPPASLTITSIAAKLSGNTSCALNAQARGADANSANAYPVSGKITFGTKTLDTEATPHPFSLQAYITLLGQHGPDPSDAFDLGGVVIKGADVGATVGGSIWEDPAKKLAKTDLEYPGYNSTGYGFDISPNTLGCLDNTGGNVTPITTLLSGDGTSPLGVATTGFQFSFGE